METRRIGTRSKYNRIKMFEEDAKAGLSSMFTRAKVSRPRPKRSHGSAHACRARSLTTGDAAKPFHEHLNISPLKLASGDRQTTGPRKQRREADYWELV